MRSRSIFWLAALTLLGPMSLGATGSVSAAEPGGLVSATGSASAQEPLNVIARQRADEKRILAALEKRTSVELQELPLRDAADYLSKTVGVTVALDRRAMEDASIPPDVPVSIAMKDVPARTILNRLLADVPLTWIVRDGVLLITTQDQAKSNESLTIRVYDVADLAGLGGIGSTDVDPLISLITSTIAPTTWDTVGGPGSIASYTTPGICSLVFSQSFEVHEQVEALLAELRKLKKTPAKPEPPAKEPPKASSSEPPMTAEQKKILAALDRRISVDLQKAPLDKALWFFRNELKERILVENGTLAGGPDKVVTLQSKNVPIRKALSAFILLADETGETVWQLGLNGIQIGNKGSSWFQQTKVYDVSDLVEGGDALEKNQSQCDQLINLITSTVAPTQWDTVGGPGTIAVYPYGKKAALIVSQEPLLHRGVAALLAELRKQRHGPPPAAAPVVVHSEPREPADPTEKALAGRITVEFNKASLSQAAEVLSKKLGVPVVLDQIALRDLAIDGKSPRHTFAAADCSALCVLDQLLGAYPEGLDWTVSDGTVLIADKATLDSDEKQVTKVYDVRDLVTFRDKTGKPIADFDSLIDLITSTADPTTWDTVGGPGSIQPFEREGTAVICLRQTRAVHEHVGRLLADLRQVLRPNAANPPLAK